MKQAELIINEGNQKKNWFWLGILII